MLVLLIEIYVNACILRMSGSSASPGPLLASTSSMYQGEHKKMGRYRLPIYEHHLDFYCMCFVWLPLLTIGVSVPFRTPCMNCL